jgi:ornithine--oxo-acid transaminase
MNEAYDRLLFFAREIKVALHKLKNATAWDVDGNEYIDMLSMFSVVNMGHAHPRLVAATTEAVQERAVINLPFLNPSYGKLAKKLHEASGKLPVVLCLPSR